MPQYADQVFMLINGVPYEIASLEDNISFGKRTPVPTMNLTGRPLGYREEVGEGTFSIEAPVRFGQPNWAAIADAVIMFVQRVGGAPIYTAIGACYAGHTMTVNKDGEQMNKVSFTCLDWKEGM